MMKEKLIQKPLGFRTISKVPILEADDICRGQFDGKNGTHCLSGWIRKISCNFDTRKFIIHKINEEISILTGKESFSIPEFNDNPKNDKRKIARLFNRVMRKLGFTKIVNR